MPSNHAMTPTEVLAVMEAAATWLPRDIYPADRVTDAIAAVRAAFAELEARQWVLVAERLPVEWESVLTWHPTYASPMRAQRYCKNWSDAVHWLVEDRSANGQVGEMRFPEPPTHWQPLPTPPQEPK